MGKGDVKSKKGKIAKGSFGNSRPHQTKKAESAATTAQKPLAKTVKK